MRSSGTTVEELASTVVATADDESQQRDLMLDRFSQSLHVNRDRLRRRTCHHR
jgi:hypothetical protein